MINPISVPTGDIKSKYFTITIDNTPRSGIEVISASPKVFVTKEVDNVNSPTVGKRVIDGIANTLTLKLPDDMRYDVGKSQKQLSIYVAGMLYTKDQKPLPESMKNLQQIRVRNLYLIQGGVN